MGGKKKKKKKTLSKEDHLIGCWELHREVIWEADYIERLLVYMAGLAKEWSFGENSSFCEFLRCSVEYHPRQQNSGYSQQHSCRKSTAGVFTGNISSVQFSHSSCPTLWFMNRSTPGLPVHHQLPEFTQTHVHRVGDVIQPSHPLLSPCPPAPNPFQHQGLFQWVNSSHKVAKVLEFQPQHQSFQWTPRTGLLYDGLVGSPCSPRDSEESSPAPQFKSINSSALSLLHSPTLTSIHDHWKNHSLD